MHQPPHHTATPPSRHKLRHRHHRKPHTVRKVAPRLADPRPLNPATRALVAAWSLAASTLVGAFVAAHAASALASASAPGGHTLPFLPPALLGLTAAAPLLTLLPVLDDAAAVATARVPPNHPTRLKVAQKLIVGAVAASFSLSLFSLFLSHTHTHSLSLSLYVVGLVICCMGLSHAFTWPPSRRASLSSLPSCPGPRLRRGQHLMGWLPVQLRRAAWRHRPRGPCRERHRERRRGARGLDRRWSRRSGGCGRCHTRVGSHRT